MNAPKIGEMRLRMSLEAPVDTPDDSGAMTRGYVGRGDIWVKLTPLSAEARFIEERQELAIHWIAQARWRADVTSEMRLVDGARSLRITSASDPDGRRRFLFCHCEEIA
ncbi:head-tail adaptor protein [Methylosinus sp. R-45379]|uniref:phage head closure protein n=1 Tax=unclassified Methylosinus TaxID=2624500 RepID=UPI000464CE61|nr:MULTISPECIES: phage head closure protein [unclassified Methylosinus]OAI29705.1 head-tail adaptor protein [Methylosinus sp. R-45379]TDX65637.1 SPP1 family predicted phage head-tail adaptor [Methylosinus sp. sav-2]